MIKKLFGLVSLFFAEALLIFTLIVIVTGQPVPSLWSEDAKGGFVAVFMFLAFWSAILVATRED